MAEEEKVDDIRSDLEAAISAQEEQEEAGGSTEDTTEPVGTEEATEAEAAPEVTDEGDKGDAPADVGDAGERDDASGAASDEDPAPAAEEEEETEQSRAPEGWKPAVREKWSDLPEEVRSEVQRREKDFAVGMQKNAEGAQYAQKMSQILRPFESAMALEGADHFSAVQSLAQTAMGLRMGSASQKASIIASLVSAYEIDIDTLDDVLASSLSGTTPEDARIDALVQQRLAPYQNMLSDLESGRRRVQEKSSHNTEQQLREFADNPDNAYFADLQGDMADLLELAGNRGRKMSLQEAYEQAGRMHPEIGPLMAKKDESRRLREGAKRVADKRAAAVSVPSGAPAPVIASEPEDIRGALEAAFSLHEAGNA